MNAILWLYQQDKRSYKYARFALCAEKT